MNHVSFLLTLNLIVAVWGAWASGKICLQAKNNGWIKFTLWSTFIAASASFTFVYFVGALKLAVLEHFIPIEHIKLTHKIMRSLLALPLFSASLIITLESWNFFWKKKNLGNLSAISLSTYTQIQNLITVENIYNTADFSWDLLSGADIAFEGIVALFLFGISLGIGVLSTWLIFKLSKEIKYGWLKEQLTILKKKIDLHKKELS